MVIRARQDLERLLALAPDVRAVVLGALEQFQPSSPSIHRDEIETLAQQSSVDEEDLWAAARLSYNLRGGGNQRWDEQLDVSRAEATGVVEQLKVVGASLDRKFSRELKIARGMPSFEHCVISCDLRYVEGDEHEPVDLVPVALVRIELDEDEHDTTFQCTAQSLTRLIEALERARTTLSRLKVMSQAKSGLGLTP